MCGIAGVLYFDGTPATERQSRPCWTCKFIADQGAVIVDGVCGLGNRRLAIQDISPSGALPMRDGDNIIAFNGEVYIIRACAACWKWKARAIAPTATPRRSSS